MTCTRAVGAAAVAFLTSLGACSSADNAERVSSPSSSSDAVSGASETTVAAHPIAVSPSFGCGSPASEAEERICADSSLARLDLRLDSVWRLGVRVMADGGAPETELNLVRAEQRGWIGGRDDCWKADHVTECIRDAYRTRIAEIEVSFALAPAGEPTFWSCRGNPADEFVVTFFETDPHGARVERGDQQEVLLAVPVASGSRYVGPFGLEIWLKGQSGTFVWPQTDTIPCERSSPR